ncbi:MAG: hypothetical protein HY242_01850 [Afipia sp.]|nr:hypothetical protein [Afipia sp.]
MAVNPALLQATVSIIADYRAGEIAAPDVAHVERWVNQFDEKVREPLLTELKHVLSRTYVSKLGVERFLSGLVPLQKLAGNKPPEFWNNAKFLDIQDRGKSQKEFLSLFAVTLKQQTGLDLANCGTNPACYIYLDDGIFTGMTLIRSIGSWLKTVPTQKAIVHVIVIAGHLGGQFYAKGELEKIVKGLGKEIEWHWWALHTVEDRKAYTDTSDVLRPTSLPEDDLTKAYAKTLRYPPVYRTAGSLGALKIFSSEQGRDLLERQLLVKGAFIKDAAKQLPKFARPLGDMVLETLGFGSTFVTYRNCPNNAPLAFWAGNPWYPLFQRKTN